MGNTDSKNKHNKNKKNNNKRRYYRNKNRKSTRNTRTSKLTSMSSIFTKYDNLLENYIRLRAKYFDFFFRADSKQRSKIKANYLDALKQLRNFEQKLTDYQKEKFRQRSYFRPDHTYSEMHNIDPSLTTVTLPNEDNFDPHINHEQKERPSFKEDTTETIGTIDDYLKYRQSK